MTINARLGSTEPAPPRSLTEVAPPAVRTFVRNTIVDRFGVVEGYAWACDQLGLEAESVWSPDWAEPRLRDVIRDANWPRIYELLEALAPADPWEEISYSSAVNAILARSGVAYEYDRGKFGPYDLAAQELGVSQIVVDTMSALKGRLAPAGLQFQRGVDALHARPIDTLGAVRETANAAEAVAKILASAPTLAFGPALDMLFSIRAEAHERALLAGMKTLYGYASQLPGARHGQHVTTEISYAEASLVVNLMGSLIVFLVNEFGSISGTD